MGITNQQKSATTTTSNLIFGMSRDIIANSNITKANPCDLHTCNLSHILHNMYMKLSYVEYALVPDRLMTMRLFPMSQ